MFVKTTTRSGRVASSLSLLKNKPASNKSVKRNVFNTNVRKATDANKENDSNKLNNSENSINKIQVNKFNDIDNSINKIQVNKLNVIDNSQVKSSRRGKNKVPVTENKNTDSKTVFVICERNVSACLGKSKKLPTFPLNSVEIVENKLKSPSCVISKNPIVEKAIQEIIRTENVEANSVTGKKQMTRDDQELNKINTQGTNNNLEEATSFVVSNIQGNSVGTRAKKLKSVEPEKKEILMDNNNQKGVTAGTCLKTDQLPKKNNSIQESGVTTRRSFNSVTTRRKFTTHQNRKQPIKQKNLLNNKSVTVRTRTSLKASQNIKQSAEAKKKIVEKGDSQNIKKSPKKKSIEVEESSVLTRRRNSKNNKKLSVVNKSQGNSNGQDNVKAEENVGSRIKKITGARGRAKKVTIASNVRNVNKNDSTNTRTHSKRTRIKKKLDYNEITLSTSQDSINRTVVKKTNRNPVYMKRRNSPIKVKDVYEFKEEVLKTTSEEEFEKGMGSLIEQLEKRFTAKEKVAKKKVLTDIKSYVNKNIGVNLNNEQNIAVKNLNNEQNIAVKNLNNDQNISVRNIINEQKEPIKNIHNEQNTLSKHVNFVQSTPMKANDNTDQLKRFNEIEFAVRRDSSSSNDNYVSSPPHEFSAPFSTPYHVITPPTETTTNKSVQILSNILLDDTLKRIPSNDSFDMNFTKPNANSTMCLPQSPWRPVIALKKNPLFIKTKKSSLPAYDQEMVIDFKLAEKSLSSPLKKFDSPQINSTKKMKQDSILNYVNSSVVVESKNACNYSLFDADQLSPVKSRPSPRKTPLRESTNLPILKKSSPVKNLSVLNDSFSFFGEENATLAKNGQPCRLSMNEVKRVVFGNKKSKKNQPRLKNAEVNVNDELDDTQVVINEMNKNKADIVTNNDMNKTEGVVGGEEDEAIDASIVGLFEDFTEEKNAPPKASYARKGRPKRQRYVSCNTDSEDEAEKVHVKKKKKDARSKEEELEVDRLAAKYNEMFKEIENYKLEVE